MTKQELLAALEPFADDQYVFVLCRRANTMTAQLVIQGVSEVKPWKEGDLPNLICLNVHEFNSEIRAIERIPVGVPK